MKTKTTIILFIILSLFSCKDEGVSFGTVEYYPDFLWVDANMSSVKKTFVFEFSPDAKSDNTTFAEFQFVDNDGKSIKEDVMQVYIDGKQLKDNRFKINSNVDSKIVTFSFSPGAKSGKYQGYLKLINHQLERLNSQVLTSGQQADAFQWTLQFSKIMNPLEKVLIWLIVAMISALAIWFFIIRPVFYPHFGKLKKSLLIEKDGRIIAQMNYSFKGARKVIFSVKKEKQSFINRLFIGEIKYLTNPVFVDKLTFSPRKKGAAVYGNGYVINPNPIPKSGVATINNVHQKLVIKIR